MKSWYLNDAEPLARESPYTFFKSPPEAIAQVQVGENVKAIFRLRNPAAEGRGAERMWVEAKSIQDGVFAGVLSNEPRAVTVLKLGDDIADIRGRHMINTDHDPQDNLVERYI